jgi:hypothetical protein
VYESLRAAELAIGDEKRRPAVARAVEQVVRADQRDPRMAEGAVRTLDLDRLAAELAARVDYHAWADRLAPAITAPAPPPPDSPVEFPPANDEAAPEHPNHPPTTASGSGSGSESGIGNEPLDRDDSEDQYHDRNDREDDEEDQDGEEFDADDNAHLVLLLPAARAARNELLAEGRTVSRDALAHRLRHNGTAIRNSRVSELLNALRREEAALNGARPKVPT